MKKLITWIGIFAVTLLAVVSFIPMQFTGRMIEKEIQLERKKLELERKLAETVKNGRETDRLQDRLQKEFHDKIVRVDIIDRAKNSPIEGILCGAFYLFVLSLPATLIVYREEIRKLWIGRSIKSVGFLLLGLFIVLGLSCGFFVFKN